MKKYFFIFLLSIVFVTLLIIARPKTSPTSISTLSQPTSSTAPLSEKLRYYSNPKYFYKYGCPEGSVRSIEISSGDGLATPFFQETCHLNNNQVRLYIQAISLYDRLKDDSSIELVDYNESSVSGFKSISYTAKNEADYFEVFLSPTRILSLRGYDKNYFSAIKNSLDLAGYPTPTPLAIPPVKILDTSKWSTHNCHNVSFKAPPKFSVKCNPNSNIVISNNQNTVAIMVKQYNGGSRRLFWQEQQNLTPKDIQNISQIEENKFGEVNGLDVFIEGRDSPILVNNANTIIIVLGGRSYNASTKTATRWDITDTITSTLKILDK